MRALLPAGALLLAALHPSPAQATVTDVYGPGARAMGHSGGGVAVVDDGASTLLNPAGLSRIRSPTVSVGVSAAMPRFDEMPPLWWDTNRDGLVDERDPPLRYSAAVDDAVGFHLQAGRHVGGRFGVGLAAYVPMGRLIRFATFEPSLPTWFMYDNRPQRYVAAVGVGGEIFRGVHIGAGVDVAASARYDVALTADAQITGDADADGELEDVVGEIVIDVHEMHLDVIPDFAPVLGLQIEMGRLVPALGGLQLGASYRGSAGLPISAVLDMQANVSIEDIGELDPIVMAVVMDAGLSLFDHYVPSRLSLGAAWRHEDTFFAYADLRHTGWRRMVLNVARVEYANVHSPLVNIDDLVVDGNFHQVDLRNVWSLRMGSEVNLPPWQLEGKKIRYLRLSARGGFGYDPTPLVGQGPESALLDADRMMFALGAGVEAWDPFELVDAPVRLDVFFQFHSLTSGMLPRSSDTPRAGYPVEAAGLPIGGRILAFGAAWGFDY